MNVSTIRKVTRRLRIAPLPPASRYAAIASPSQEPAKTLRDSSEPSRHYVGSPPSQAPEISRFFGIIVGMFYAEHGIPHFHAVFGGEKVSIGIHTRTVLGGTLPPRALRLVLEWAHLHERELLENWRRARRGEPLQPIASLE